MWINFYSIILFCLFIILVECAGDESNKNLQLFSGFLKNILKQFSGKEKASTSNNDQLSMSYIESAKMLNIFEEKIANKFLNVECHAEMKIDFYKIISESELLKMDLEKEEFSPEENIQMVKLLLSFAIRLISIIGEYELNQVLVKESKEIKLANFLVAYNCVDKVLSNAQMNSIYPFRIFNEEQQNVVIKFDGNMEQNFELKFETLIKLFSLKKYTIREWIKYVKHIDKIMPYYRYNVADTHNFQNPLDLLMVTWTGRTTPIQLEGYNFDIYTGWALKNLGINMAELLLRKSRENGLDTFPAIKKDLEKMIKNMNEMLKENKTKSAPIDNEYFNENFAYHYENAIILGQNLSEEYNEIVKKTEKIIVDCKEQIRNCIENKYNEMEKEIKKNLDIIWKLNNEEKMIRKLKDEYLEKLKKFKNLTDDLNNYKPDINIFSRYLPSVLKSNKKKRSRNKFEKIKKEWEKEETTLKELMERMLKILKWIQITHIPEIDCILEYILETRIVQTEIFAEYYSKRQLFRSIVPNDGIKNLKIHKNDLLNYYDKKLENKKKANKKAEECFSMNEKALIHEGNYLSMENLFKQTENRLILPEDLIKKLESLEKCVLDFLVNSKFFKYGNIELILLDKLNDKTDEEKAILTAYKLINDKNQNVILKWKWGKNGMPKPEEAIYEEGDDGFKALKKCEEMELVIKKNGKGKMLAKEKDKIDLMKLLKYFNEEQLFLREFPNVVFYTENKNIPEKKCSICLKDYKEKNKLERLYCGHYYHWDCMQTYRKSKKFTCPLCRAKLIN